MRVLVQVVVTGLDTLNGDFPRQGPSTGDRRQGPQPTRPDTLTMLIKEGEEKAPPNDHGFPPGCFLLRSVSSGRLLDVASDSIQDGTPIILWPEKDNSLVEGKSLISSRHFFMNVDERIGFRRPEAANQVSNSTSCPSVSPPLTIFEGILHRHQRCPLRSRIRTRA